MLPQCSHKCSRITRKRGVYYRRRLPRPHSGEIAVSLRTRWFRGAQALAAILDSAFDKFFASRAMTTDSACRYICVSDESVHQPPPRPLQQLDVGPQYA
jgi:hypothetical protein